MTGVKPLIEPQERDGVIANPCAACGIRDLVVCGALDSHDIGRLNAIVRQVHVGHGETLFFETDPAANLYVITDGCMKVYKLLADGRRQITGFLFRSDFLGLAFQDRYAYSAEAVAGTTLCRFPKQKLEALLAEFPAMEERLLKLASNELAAAQDQMLLLGRKTAGEKLASFLLTLLHRAALKGQPHPEISVPMSRADIADYLGLTIETVSRSFTKLRKSGFISIDDPKRVVIDDPDALAELAGIDEDFSDDLPTASLR